MHSRNPVSGFSSRLRKAFHHLWCAIGTLGLYQWWGYQALREWFFLSGLFILLVLGVLSVFIMAVLGWPPAWSDWRKVLEHSGLDPVGTLVGIFISAWLVTRELLQRRYAQAWQALQQRVEQAGSVTLEHVQAWFEEKLYRHPNLYPLLGKNAWMNVLEKELRRRPFGEFYTSPELLRIFLRLAFFRSESHNTRHIFSLLLCWTYTAREWLWDELLRQALIWWKNEKYRQEGWVILAWMLWGVWEYMRQQGEERYSSEQPSPFCKKILQLFHDVISNQTDDTPLLASLLADEALQRAGVHCPQITAAAYRPDKTL